MQLFNSDLLTLITRELPIRALAICVQSNKQIYSIRHEFVHLNKNMLQYQNQANMSYVYAMHNSHIVDMCDLDDIQLQLSDTDKKKVYTTCKLLSCCTEPFLYTGKLKHYIQDFMQTKYNDKIESLFIGIVDSHTWWRCNVALIDLYETVYLCKKRKYRQLHECLQTMHIESNESNMHYTLQFMIGFMELLRSKAIKACLIYVIYAFVYSHIDCIISNANNKSLTKTIIAKSYEFAEHIEKMKVLPKYLKTLIIYQIIKTRELLISNTHISYALDS